MEKKYCYIVGVNETKSFLKNGAYWDKYKLNPFTQKKGCFYVDDSWSKENNFFEPYFTKVEDTNKKIVSSAFAKEEFYFLFQKENWKEYMKALPYLYRYGSMNSIILYKNSNTKDYDLRDFDEWNKAGFKVYEKSRNAELVFLYGNNLTKIIKGMNYSLEKQGFFDIGRYRISKNQMERYDIEKKIFCSFPIYEMVYNNIDKNRLKQFLECSVFEKEIVGFKRVSLYDRTQVKEDSGKLKEVRESYNFPYSLFRNVITEEKIFEKIFTLFSLLCPEPICFVKQEGYFQDGTIFYLNEKTDIKQALFAIMKMVVITYIEKGYCFTANEDFKEYISSSVSCAVLYGILEDDTVMDCISVIKDEKIYQDNFEDILNTVFLLCHSLSKQLKTLYKSQEYSDAYQEERYLKNPLFVREVVHGEPLEELKKEDFEDFSSYIEKVGQAESDREEKENVIKDLFLTCKINGNILEESIHCEHGEIIFNNEDNIHLSFNLSLERIELEEGSILYLKCSDMIAKKGEYKYTEEDEDIREEVFVTYEYVITNILDECIIMGMKGEILARREDEEEKKNIVPLLEIKNISMLFANNQTLDLSSILVPKEELLQFAEMKDTTDQDDADPDIILKNESTEVPFSVDEWKEMAYLNGVKERFADRIKIESLSNVFEIPFFKEIPMMASDEDVRSIYEEWLSGYRSGNTLKNYHLSQIEWESNDLVGVIRTEADGKRDICYVSTLKEFFSFDNLEDLSQDSLDAFFYTCIQNNKVEFSYKENIYRVILLNKEKKDSVTFFLQGYLRNKDIDSLNDLSLNSDMANKMLFFMEIERSLYYDVPVVYYVAENVLFPSDGLYVENLSLSEAIIIYKKIKKKDIACIGAILENSFDILLYPLEQDKLTKEPFKSSKRLFKALEIINEELAQENFSSAFTGEIESKKDTKDDIQVEVWSVRESCQKTYQWRDYEYLIYNMKKKVSITNYQKTISMRIKKVQEFSTFLEDLFTLSNRSKERFSPFLIEGRNFNGLRVGDVVSLTTSGVTIDYYVNPIGFIKLPFFSGQERGSEVYKKEDARYTDFIKLYQSNPTLAIWEMSDHKITKNQAKIMSVLDERCLMLPKNEKTMKKYFDKGLRLAEKILSYPSSFVVVACGGGYPLFNAGEVLSLRATERKITAEIRAYKKIKFERGTSYLFGGDDIQLFLIMKRNIEEMEVCVLPLTIHIMDEKNESFIKALERDMNNIIKSCLESLSYDKIFGVPLTSEKKRELKKAIENLQVLANELNKYVKRYNAKKN